MATGPFITQEGPTGGSFGNYQSTYRSARNANGDLVLENNPYIRSRTVVKNNRSWSPPLGTEGLAYYYSRPKDVLSEKGGADAYTKAYDRFADGVWGDAQLLLAVDYAERGETLKMLGDALLRLAKAAYLVRHRQFKEAMKALRATKPGKDFKPSEEFFANWMALRYGWGPTLGSIHSLCEVLAKPINGKNGLRVSASAKSSYKYQTIDAWTFAIRTAGEWNIRVRISGKVAISDPRLASLNQYGLVNPLVVAWELVSRSFVVGWFLPIGDILADLTRFVGLSFSQASVSYRIDGWDKVYVYGPPTVEYTTVLKQRVPFTGAPPIPSRFVLGNGLNPKRCLDALALLVGEFRKR